MRVIWIRRVWSDNDGDNGSNDTCDDDDDDYRCYIVATCDRDLKRRIRKVRIKIIIMIVIVMRMVVKELEA